MNKSELKRALDESVAAAREAGGLMRHNQWRTKKVNLVAPHDIKLELDIECQKLIERRLQGAFPQAAILGEEGTSGDWRAPYRWVIDPIDGTVNFTYGIPHACVSVALQGWCDAAQESAPASGRAGSAVRRASAMGPVQARGFPASEFGAYRSLVGVVFDPFCDELWTAIRGQPARLNGRPIHVSDRRHLKETVITLGFAKHEPGLMKLVPRLEALVHRVRKIRIMGSAALDLVYVATGRFDAYLEAGVRLWDIAAGGLIIECAGGEFWSRPVSGEHFYQVVATNGLLRKQLERLFPD